MRSYWPRLISLVLCLAAGIAIGHVLHRPQAKKVSRILYYQDPMHPSYRSDKPGIAPDCGMQLVPVYTGDVAQSLANDPNRGPGSAVIDPAVQQLYGIRLSKAQIDAAQARLLLYAQVEADETRIFRVDFGTDGYVKETHGDAIGTRVAKDQHLATVYSPDFLSVAGGYLAANEHAPGAPNAVKDNFNSSTSSQGAASVLARADRLRNLGMSDSQIDEISRTHKLPEDVYIVSPVDGYILSRNISPGMRFERHNELYAIADLSHVWITAEVFGHDVDGVRIGAPARIEIPDSHGSTSAVVKAILPEVDRSTRAVKVRLQAENPGLKLRPGMFVNLELHVSAPPALTIPTDAVLDSGLAKRVFVQSDPDRFQPRLIETGWESGDRVQVLKGLREGEFVVSSGAFLVDSESRLRMPSGTAALSADAPPIKAANEHRTE